MRLTTLARKIEKTPSQLITFLEDEGIEIPNGLHSKLDSETVTVVMNQFMPEHLEEESIIETPAKEEPLVQAIEETKSITESEELEIEEAVAKEPIIEEIVEEEVEEPIAVPESEPESPKSGTLEDLENEDFESIEHIKVKKVTLEGIKVVGKIELPEKPKKEKVDESVTEEANKETTDTTSIKPRSKNQNFNRDRKKNRNSKSRTPLSYEDKMKEEKREKLKKRRRKENAEKKRKTKFYEENLKPKTQKGTKKKKQKNPSEIQATAKKEVVIHRNPIKRLWAWLNGEYDKY